MRVALGTFARSGIETQLGNDVAGAVQAALSHYAGKLKAGRPPVVPPQFYAEPLAESERVIDLAVDTETEALLEREAAKYGTDVSHFAAHTVMVYLAELDFLASPLRPV